MTTQKGYGSSLGHNFRSSEGGEYRKPKATSNIMVVSCPQKDVRVGAVITLLHYVPYRACTWTRVLFVAS